MRKKKVMTLKGMTIMENIVAFTLIITALTIAGTGFYIASEFIMKGRMYDQAADTAQCMLESGLLDNLEAAFKDGKTDGYNKFTDQHIKDCMGNVVNEKYTLTDNNYYLNTNNWIVIRPYSSSDGNIDPNKNDADYTNDKCVVSTMSIGVDELRKLKGMYVYICVPVDETDVFQMKDKQSLTALQAVGMGEYVPIAYYIGDWPY